MIEATTEVVGPVVAATVEVLEDLQCETVVIQVAMVLVELE